MSGSTFVYVTYIRATREKIWDALTKPELTRTFWFGHAMESSWEAGSDWQLVAADGALKVAGQVLEVEPAKHLALKWRHEFRPDLKAEGDARCAFDLEPTDGAVKVTVRHEIDRAGSGVIETVSGSWPKVLSSLKSLVETGIALPQPGV